MGILLDILACFVDLAIRQQEHLHPKLLGNHILAYIIANHQTFFRLNTKLDQNVPVIIQIGFAVAGILVGSVQFKIFRPQACPLAGKMGFVASATRNPFSFILCTISAAAGW